MPSNTKAPHKRLFLLTVKQHFKAGFASLYFLSGPRRRTNFKLKQRQVGLTSVAEVIHQDDLCNQAVGSAVDDAVDGAQERSPALVMEGDDDARVG